MANAERKLIADRLTRLLTSDLDTLETWFKDKNPAGADGATAAAIKTRVDAIALVTRTLEKLLELKRLEALALAEGSEEDEAETARLRRELMRRLRALDARRAEGAGLFADVPS